MDSSAGSLGRGHNRLPELWSVSVIVSCLMIEAAFIHSLRPSVRHSAHFHLCSGKLTLMFAPKTSMRYGGGRAHREIDRWRDGWMDVEMDSCENTAAAPPATRGENTISPEAPACSELPWAHREAAPLAFE